MLQIVEQAQEKNLFQERNLQLDFPKHYFVSFQGIVSYQKRDEGTIICFPVHTNFFNDQLWSLSYQDTTEFEQAFLV